MNLLKNSPQIFLLLISFITAQALGQPTTYRPEQLPALYEAQKKEKWGGRPFENLFEFREFSRGDWNAYMEFKGVEFKEGESEYFLITTRNKNSKTASEDKNSEDKNFVVKKVPSKWNLGIYTIEDKDTVYSYTYHEVGYFWAGPTYHESKKTIISRAQQWWNKLKRSIKK